MEATRTYVSYEVQTSTQPVDRCVGEIHSLDDTACVLFCLIGILKATVFKPVMAHKVLVTEESIPPDTPITKDSAFLGIELT